MKMRAGISRGNLAGAPDQDHTHAVFFLKGKDTCLGYFQHPPPAQQIASQHFAANGVDPESVERLWATRERQRAMSAEVYAEERAAAAARRDVDQADARAVGAVWLQVLKAQDPSITKARLRNFIRWLNEDELFNGS